MHLFDIPLKSLPKTAPRTIKLMSYLTLETYEDLIRHIPYRYEDYSSIQTIAQLTSLSAQTSPQIDELISKSHPVCIGTLTHFHSIATRRGVTMQIGTLEDATGKIECIWFNQPYLRNILRVGKKCFIAGPIGSYKGKAVINPVIQEVLTEEDRISELARIIPVYQQTKGLSSKTIREKVHYILTHHAHDISSPLPESLEKSYNLMPCAEAFQALHFPASKEELIRARHRFAFEELFIAQLSSHIIKKEWKAQHGAPVMPVDTHIQSHSRLQDSLPYALTQAQHDAISEILADLGSDQPMNRLLQGDVGSGKTIVALFAAYHAYLHGYNTIYMAPTEILAQQHLASFQSTFQFLPEGERPSCILVSRSSKPSQAELNSADITIGTHALLDSKIPQDKIGLVIVDEQHKFGVVQRAKLKEKGLQPHLLSMTATPIPRTVMLTLYGELDVSRLYEVPTGRKKILTYVVPEAKRSDSYAWIDREIAQGAQVFVICPFIEQSDSDKLVDVKAVTQEFELIRTQFPTRRVGMLHGKLSSAQKDAILHDFAEKKLDILVATPVIEVGIDIPGATIIVIEAAERFGLAQLHQLRGRVGRSDKQSHCLLFTQMHSDDVRSRLSMFSKTHDGYALAEFDLTRRGAGTLYGTYQHGLGDLRIASLSDTELVHETQEAVVKADLSAEDVKHSETLTHALATYTHTHVSRD